MSVVSVWREAASADRGPPAPGHRPPQHPQHTRRDQHVGRLHSQDQAAEEEVQEGPLRPGQGQDGSERGQSGETRSPILSNDWPHADISRYQDIGDKLIEVVGLENCLHMGQVNSTHDFANV